MDDSNYLENINSDKDFFLRLRNIFRKLRHTFFGNIFPSQNQPKDEEKKSSKSKESEEDDLTRHYVPPRYFNKEQPAKGLKNIDT